MRLGESKDETSTVLLIGTLGGFLLPASVLRSPERFAEDVYVVLFMPLPPADHTPAETILSRAGRKTEAPGNPLRWIVNLLAWI